MSELRPGLLSLLAAIFVGDVHGVESTGSKYQFIGDVHVKVTPQVDELMANELACKGEVEDGAYPVLLTPAGELELKRSSE